MRSVLVPKSRDRSDLMERRNLCIIDDFVSRAGKNGMQAHIMPTSFSIVLVDVSL